MGTKRQNVVLFDMPAFTEDVAQKVGLSRRQIERSVARARIEPELRELLGRTRWADHGTTLDALAKAPPAVRAKLVAALTRAVDPAQSLGAAMAEVQPRLNPNRSVDDEQLARLQSAWRKAGKRARDMFLDDLLVGDRAAREMAAQLLADLEDGEGRVMKAIGGAA
jgi:hypothetical protein